MRIEITRSGGFAGLTRTWALEVSRTEAEQHWLPLAEAEAGTGADGQDPATQTGGGGQRDRFTYRIAVGYVEVQFAESRLEDPWRELVERARSASERATGAPDAGPGASDAGPGATERGGPRKPPELL